MDNEQSKARLNQYINLKRGAAIIDGKQEQFRQDGYTNLLNKYGTKQDSSTAYRYSQEPIANDMELIRLYEGNGLFTKIIDRPSEEAVKHGLDIDFGDESIAEYVDDRLDELGFEDKFATAEKWARLYGGSIIVMLVDDGCGLEEPLDWNNVRSIEELRVFERAVVQPDYSSLYVFNFADSTGSNMPFAEPEYYQVYSIYGYFTVHSSRCLIFRNGRLPEHTTNAIYRYWGIPEYVKIKRALRECITSHEDGVKLLERSVQAIYKMKNLANMLSTTDGEDKVLQRLQVIDMARGLLNSIAIDNEGEDYDFKTIGMAGVKDVIDSTCNMLSAVTNIPQTILFGRSPSGMNSTGESDLENYYNMVENIQKQNMKANARTLIDLILKQGKIDGSISEIPKYKTKFAALWSMSETEKTQVEQTKAATALTKAQTVQLYMDANVLDPSEVRNSIAKDCDFEIAEVLSEDDLELPEDTINVGNEVTSKPSEQFVDNVDSSVDNFRAVAVLVIHDGKVLCASRHSNEGLCGPGGKIEDGETPEQTAVRESMEEFNIVPLNLIPYGEYKGGTGLYLKTKLYFTDDFIGIPEADNEEMFDTKWLTLAELDEMDLFPPFRYAVDDFIKAIKYLTNSSKKGTVNVIENDGGKGSGRYPKGSGKKNNRASDTPSKKIVGTKTSDGKVIKSIHPHAKQQMKARNIYPESVTRALKNAKPKPGNKEGRSVYDYNGTRVVVIDKKQEIGTVIYKGKGDK